MRHILASFRSGDMPASQAASELGVSRSRLYQIYADYLRAVPGGLLDQWQPGVSGGSRRNVISKKAEALLRKLLSADPPCSYRFATSELLRRLALRIDSATVRRFAIANSLCPSKPLHRPSHAAVRRWQCQDTGALWQLDASPHKWLPPFDQNLPLLDILDDCSRLITGARIYARETLLAYLDFLPRAFLQHGLPLALYVDYHSFFFSSVPEALTQLGTALRFYGVALRYAPTPQAKGKIERLHLFWQKRLPALFAAENISRISRANPLIGLLRIHHNSKEIHRELRMTPLLAHELAIAQGRSVVRSSPACPWWPYVWSIRSQVSVASDGCVPIGSLRLPVQSPHGSKLTRCQHSNGDFSLLHRPPEHGSLPLVILHFPTSRPVQL